MKAYDNYIFDLYGTLADIHTEENDPLVWKKLALFYGYYDADYSSEELKERYAAIIAGEESKMKSEKKDDAHEAHPEVQIEEVFQKLFGKRREGRSYTCRSCRAVLPDPLYRLCKTL